MNNTVRALLLSMMLLSTPVLPAMLPEKLPLCLACHGQTGIAPNPVWPNLAGQHSIYLKKMLLDFKSGKYPSPVMSSIAATLSNKDIIELSNFYAEQMLPDGSVPEKYLKRGELLYRGGDLDKHITACIACHGPNGTGNGQAGFPVLSGQHARYIVDQLQAFKNKTRTNDLNSIMHDISVRMDTEDMEAVAYYVQGLH